MSGKYETEEDPVKRNKTKSLGGKEVHCAVQNEIDHCGRSWIRT